MSVSRFTFGLSIVLLLPGIGEGLLAQDPPPAAPNPAAPKIDMPVPLGGQRGGQIEITLSGSNLAEPTALWCSFPAKVTFPETTTKEANKLKVRLEIAHDAPLGFHAVRLATMRGMSNTRIFCVDDLPQVLEKDGNREKKTAQSVPLPCVVVGKVEKEVSDYFKIKVTAGQRVSFEVLGRRLGSPLDPQITLFDARTERELPGGHNNDSPGLQTDCRLTYLFKEAGEYLVEVRDTLWRGGDEYWYRLRIGDFPCATTPLPMAARRGSQRSISFAGPYLDGVTPLEIALPTDPLLNAMLISPRGKNGLHGWPVTLAISDLEEFQEQEPNNDPAKANRIGVPGAVTGRFLESNDIDHFVFAGKKGQRYVIEAQTLELNSPTEVYMVVKDAKGTQVAAVNPQTGPRFDFTASADADYTLSVEHLLYWNGTSETYRIAVTHYQPGFDLALDSDRFDVTPGSVVPIKIFATRRDYAGPIEVDVVGPAGLSGSATIKAGAPAAPNQPAATLYLKSRVDLPPGPYVISLRGSAAIAGKNVTQLARVRASLSQSLGGLVYPPMNLLTTAGIAVTAKAPFTLTAAADPAPISVGGTLSVNVHAERDQGFADDIALSIQGLPANVTAAAQSIAKGQKDAKLQLKVGPKAPVGEFTFTVTGKAKQQNREVSFLIGPVAGAIKAEK